MSNWYDKGICFSCEGCGGCCSGEPGYVWINDDEIAAMVQELALDTATFMQRYTRKAQGKISLIEKENYDCIFLTDNKCAVYGARPIQCSTYPFWKTNLISREDFIEGTQNCPGTHLDKNESASLHTVTQIEEIAASSTL